MNAQGKVIETQQDVIGGKRFLRCASPRCRKYTCSAQYRNGKLKNSIQPFENHFNTKHAPVDPKGTLSLFCIAASNALQNCRPAENFPASEAPPLQVQPEVLIKPVSGAQFPANRELSEFGQELSTLLRNKNAKVLDECFHLLMVGLDLVEKVTLVEATFFPEEGLFRLSGPPVAGKVLLPVGHLYLKDSKPASESDDAPRSNPADLTLEDQQKQLGSAHFFYLRSSMLEKHAFNARKGEATYWSGQAVCEWKLTSELEDDVVVDLPDRMSVVDKGTFPWGIELTVVMQSTRLFLPSVTLQIWGWAVTIGHRVQIAVPSTQLSRD